MADPPSIANTLLLDLDPDAVVGADGSAIAALPDGVGANDATQATAANRPVLKIGANGLNGHQVARFDGVNDYLRTPSMTSRVTWTTFVVGMVVTPAAGPRLLDGMAAGNRHILVVDGDGKWAIHGGAPLNSSVAGDTAWHVFVATFTATDTLHLDGTQVVSGNAGSHPFVGLTLAADYSVPAGNASACDIARLLVYEGAVDAADRASVDSWVQDTYGITVADYVSGGPDVVTGESAASAESSATAVALVEVTGAANVSAQSEASAAALIETTGEASASAQSTAVATADSAAAATPGRMRKRQMRGVTMRPGTSPPRPRMVHREGRTARMRRRSSEGDT